MEVLQSDAFKPSADELLQYIVNISIEELLLTDTDDRSRLAENEREIEPHQIIHDLVKLFFLVIPAVDRVGLLNCLHVEQNFQLLVEQTCLAVRYFVPYLAVTLLAVADDLQNPCIKCLPYISQHDILDVRPHQTCFGQQQTLDVFPNSQTRIKIFQNIRTSTEYGIEGDLITNRKIGIEFRCIKVVKVTDMLYQ